MTRLALFLAVLASPVVATPWGDGYIPRAPDEFSLEVLSDDEARVDYWNADPPNSGHFPQELTDGDLTVRLRLDVGQGAEVIHVFPPEGWIADPPFLSVEDGDTGSIMLRRWQGLGM